MAYCWLKKRGNVYYLFFSKKVGCKPYSLHTSDKKKARAAQVRVEDEIWCNEKGFKRKITTHLRYSDLVRRFIEHKKANGINPKTITNYLRTLNRFGVYLQSDMLIEAISPEHVEAFVSLRRNSPAQHGDGKIAPKTIRNEVFTFVNLFAWATERDFLADNPMRKVTKPRRVIYDAPRALTYDEYLKLKKAITNEKFSDIIDLYLLTGIRRSDGLRLTSENFDFTSMIATLPQHKQGTHKRIPIGQELAEVVRRIIARVGEGKPLVQLHPSRLSENFREARIRAELPDSITFHSLRHTFASWLAALGTDFKTLQELIGHRSGEATQIYVHAFNPNKRSAIEKLILPKRAANG